MFQFVHLKPLSSVFIHVQRSRSHPHRFRNIENVKIIETLIFPNPRLIARELRKQHLRNSMTRCDRGVGTMTTRNNSMGKSTILTKTRRIGRRANRTTMWSSVSIRELISKPGNCLTRRVHLLRQCGLITKHLIHDLGAQIQLRSHLILHANHLSLNAFHVTHPGKQQIDAHGHPLPV